MPNASPRSARLLAYVFGGTGASLSPMYVSPSNMTTIVKSVSFQNTTGAAIACSIVGRTINPQRDIALAQTTVAAQGQAGFEISQVLNPGEGVYGFSNAPGIQIWVSGSVLQGGPPITPAELAAPQVFAEEPNALTQSRARA